jgi:hypothetical protein
MRAGFDQGLGDGRAERSGAAGDDNVLVLQITHGRASPESSHREAEFPGSGPKCKR